MTGAKDAVDEILVAEGRFFRLPNSTPWWIVASSTTINAWQHSIYLSSGLPA